jgi:DNA-binding NtrC family response regulator
MDSLVELYNHKSVVVFEDNLIWGKAVALWLRKYGFSEVRVFNTKDDMKNHFQENCNVIDVCIIDFYDQNASTEDLIKDIRNMSPYVLIIAMSADFINDNDVINTKEMIKAIEAGANRVTFKNISHLKLILDEHIKARASSEYQEIISILSDTK